MILCVDIGNTNICVGVYDDDGMIYMARLATERSRTSDQYAVELCSLFALNGIDRAQIDGAVIGSVVPELTGVIRRTVKQVAGCDAMIMGPGLHSGMRIRIDNPAQLGADLLAGAVAAADKYPLPCLVMDLGTATKISVVGEQGDYLGCTICPGVMISLNALSAGTSQLPSIDLSDPSIKPFGKNTIDSMQAGTVLGTAAMLDGLCRRILDELGVASASVVSTGGLAEDITKHCRCGAVFAPDLVLDGLALVYRKNRG